VPECRPKQWKGFAKGKQASFQNVLNVKLLAKPQSKLRLSDINYLLMSDEFLTDDSLFSVIDKLLSNF